MVLYLRLVAQRGLDLSAGGGQQEQSLRVSPGDPGTLPLKSPLETPSFLNSALAPRLRQRMDNGYTEWQRASHSLTNDH